MTQKIRTNLIRNSRGVTLAEIMIALAINAIIVLAVVTLVSNTMLSGKSSENRQELATDFGLLQNYFARTIPNAGGMSIPTDASFWVENDCAAVAARFPNCQHSDRLTIASSDEGPVCTIVSYNPVTGAGTLNTVAGPTGPICCMQNRPILHNHVLFTNGYDFAQKWMVTADLPSCSGTFTPGPMAANDSLPPSEPWTGAVIVPVHIDAFFYQPADNTFNRFVYTDGGPSAVDGSTQVLADRVLDFQVALGYDFNTADGAVDDDGSANDEWLYNSTADDRTHAPFVGVSPAPNLPKNALRMIAVGWIIGTPNAGAAGSTQASVLDGPVRSKANYTLQAGVAKLGARSVYVFD